MDAPIRYESIQEPLDEEERELMDPDNWDWENPIEVVMSEDLVISMPIEVTPEEFDLISHVARTEGLSPHEFMKRLALNAARTASTELAPAPISRQDREWRSG